jgi:thiosulfate dehydrogenase [quinone] large subunit
MSAHITSPVQLRESRTAHFLFADPRASYLWLVVRIWVGLQWIEAGYGKVTNPAWVGEKAGAGLTGFVMGALEKASGEHPAVQGWYADFLQSVVLPNASVFSYMVAFGEVAVGLGLILGMLTGIAAFFGVLMNTNFLLAGTVSTNPILALPGILLVLAWRNAGWFGLDRWVLPLVGTPWQHGSIFDEIDAKK